MAPRPRSKLTINISPELHGQLQQLAAERRITVTELIRRAVALDKFVYENRDSDLLMKTGDNVKQIVRI